MSQRHKLEIQSFTAAGEIIAQGAIAPGYILQAGDAAPMVEGPRGGPLQGSTFEPEPVFEVPAGPPGGPLQGSSLAGPIPEDLAPVTPPEPEPNPDAPTITSLAPATAVIGSTDFTMRVLGTNFIETSVITFNGGDEATEFVSDTELTTGIKPSTAGTPGDYPVQVKNGTLVSNYVNFSFTEAAAPEGGERTFPMGPFNIVQVTYDDELGQLVFQLDPAASGAIENGDTILVEATGTTAVNGTYTAENVAGPEFSVTMAATPLTGVIDNKGRATVTGGE
jgi:IPT/TIG domain